MWNRAELPVHSWCLVDGRLMRYMTRHSSPATRMLLRSPTRAPSAVKQSSTGVSSRRSSHDELDAASSREMSAPSDKSWLDWKSREAHSGKSCWQVLYGFKRVLSWTCWLREWLVMMIVCFPWHGNKFKCKCASVQSFTGSRGRKQDHSICLRNWRRQDLPEYTTCDKHIMMCGNGGGWSNAVSFYLLQPSERD